MFRKVIVRRAGAKGWARGGKRREQGLGNTSSQITYYFSFTTGQKAKYQLNFSEQQKKIDVLISARSRRWHVCPSLFVRWLCGCERPCVSMRSV